MHANTAISAQVSGIENKQDRPNLVMACTYAGAFLGMYSGWQVASTEPEPQLAIIPATALASVTLASMGFVFGYALHHSLLAVVDGVKMISNCLGTTESSTSSSTVDPAPYDPSHTQ